MALADINTKPTQEIEEEENRNIMENKELRQKRMKSL